MCEGEDEGEMERAVKEGARCAGGGGGAGLPLGDGDLF